MAVNRIVPHLPWIVLFALAFHLYKARVLADSGFYVSQFINNQTFWIECNRIVLGISQIIPLIGVWLGIEIKYVLILYSLSHVIFFYLLFLFVYYGLRDRQSGLLIILLQTVGIMFSFYTPMFELYYGMALMITFYALWRLPFRINVLFVPLLLEVLILLSHPLAFMLFLFLLLYDYEKGTAKPIKFYIPVAVVFIGAIVFKCFVMCPYETGKLAWQFNYAENKQYLQLITPSFYKTLAMFTLRYYSEVLVAFVLVIYMLVNKRQWFKLLVVVGTFLAYFFLVNSNYSIEPSRYMEQVMFPFVPILFIPLIYGFPKMGRQGLVNISVLLVSALIVYRLAVIYSCSESYMTRVAQMEQLIKSARQKGGSKFIVSEDVIDHGYTQMNWSHPIESMLLSAIDGNDISITIAPEEDLYFENNNNKMAPNQFMFRKWEIKDHSWLNKRYFHLDIGNYRTINDTLPNPEINNTANQLRLEINAKKLYRASDTVWIPITITNHGNTPIYSGKKNKVFLSYFWEENSEVLNWTEIRTPLQADLRSSLEQHIKVAVPAKRGHFQLKVDMIANDKWLGLHSQADITVF